MKRNKNSNDASKSYKLFDNFVQDCRNYDLWMSREWFIKSLDQFTDHAYKFAMFDDAKTVVLIIEAEDAYDDF